MNANMSQARTDTVAVIIPVWNGASYIWMLEKCVDSVLKQTYPVTQILLMDDGSTEQITLDCLERLAAEHPAIELAHLPHGGISAARNAGLDRVTSDWILFLDSDDFWEPEFVEGLVKAAGPDTQLVCCGAQIVDHEGKKLLCKQPNKERLSDERFSPYVNCRPGPRLWKSTFIIEEIKWRYPLGCIMEDEVFGAFAIAAAKHMAFSPQYGYNARMRENSTCHSRRSFNNSGMEQLPFTAFREGLERIHPASPWQEQTLYCRILHAMMAMSWVFCCYAEPEQRRQVASAAAELLRDLIPHYPKLLSTAPFRALWSLSHRIAARFYILCVKLHLELSAQTLFVGLARLFYRLKGIA